MKKMTHPMSQFIKTDKNYTSWIEELSQRYRKSQIKAATHVNSEMLQFYWSLGRDIVTLHAESRWGDKILKSLKNAIWRIPWGHHKYIIDRFFNEPEKAMFFVQKTLENGWSRNVLLDFMDTNLYERQGKAISNFKASLPSPLSDLAQEMTKDPYQFDFLIMTEGCRENISA